MAKPTTYATPICLVLSVLAIIGIYFGVKSTNPLIVLFALLPAVGYEAYRTEGDSTRWASWILLIAVIAEIILIIKNISFDFAKYMDSSYQYVGGYTVPLGDIKIVGPALMAVLSGILFFRTNGKYTKWLAVIIFVASFATIYILSPEFLKSLLQMTLQQGSYWY